MSRIIWSNCELDLVPNAMEVVVWVDMYITSDELKMSWWYRSRKIISLRDTLIPLICMWPPKLNQRSNSVFDVLWMVLSLGGWYILCTEGCLSFSLYICLCNGPFPTLYVPVRVMENEEGRKEYLVFPPSKNQCPASSQKGRKIPLKGNGRRIDYILYSDEGLQQDWKLVMFNMGLLE